MTTAKTSKERSEALSRVLADVTDADRQETKEAIALHDQDLVIGRVHNNVDRTKQSLEDAEDELHQTQSCGWAVLICLFGKCACSDCCKPKVPHHDQDIERRHPAPVLISEEAKKATAKPETELTEREKRRQILAKLKHQEGTLTGEIGELRDTNKELGEIITEVDETKKRTKEDAAKSTEFVAKNKGLS